MTVDPILALIAELYTAVGRLSAENAQLRKALTHRAPAPAPDERFASGPAGSEV